MEERETRLPRYEFRDELARELREIRKSEPNNPREGSAMARGYLAASKKTQKYSEDEKNHIVDRIQGINIPFGIEKGRKKYMEMRESLEEDLENLKSDPKIGYIFANARVESTLDALVEDIKRDLENMCVGYCVDNNGEKVIDGYLEGLPYGREIGRTSLYKSKIHRSSPNSEGLEDVEHYLMCIQPEKLFRLRINPSRRRFSVKEMEELYVEEILELEKHKERLPKRIKKKLEVYANLGDEDYSRPEIKERFPDASPIECSRATSARDILYINGKLKLDLVRLYNPWSMI